VCKKVVTKLEQVKKKGYALFGTVVFNLAKNYRYSVKFHVSG
jgi:hypothetical protein